MEMKGLNKKYFRKDINILQAYYYKPPKFEKYRPHMMYILPVLGFLVGFSLIYYVFFYRPLVAQQVKTSQVKTQRAEVEELLNSSIGEKNYQEYQTTKAEVEKYELMLEIIKTYPKLNLDHLNAILETTLGASITNFSYDNNTHAITVSYEAPSQDTYPKILSQLRALNIFDSIEYNGYQGVERDITETQLVPTIENNQTQYGINGTTNNQNSQEEVIQEQNQTSNQQSIEYHEEEVVVGQKQIYTSTITYVLKGGSLEYATNDEDSEQNKENTSTKDEGGSLNGKEEQ